MTTLYGIKNCDTCRKARKALEERGVEHRFHDLRQDGLDETLLDRLLGKVEWTTLLNRQSQTWRKLDEADKRDIDAAGARRLMLAHPTLIKRPLLERGDDIRVGYRAGDYDDVTA